jgi:hypothetical protein
MKNQPAFPVPLSEHQTLKSTAANGMTLRDYFAAKAMQGVMSNKMYDHHTPEELADTAYMWADNMLKAREQ